MALAHWGKIKMTQKITDEILKKVITKRKSNTHKGNYGRILLIGGSQNYGGAIIMSTEGALGSGAGLIATATDPVNLTALHARDPEAMFLDYHDSSLASLIAKMDVVVCGPGLGTDGFAKKIVQIVRDNVGAKQTVVLDASALDLISKDYDLLPLKAGHIVMTPHQMEWQRVSQIQIPFQNDENNLRELKELVPKGNVTLILKSNHTHVYGENKQVYVNTTGNPGMATGGMGDTLAGITGGFIAQFGSSLDSILAAVYIHSLAGDLLYRDHYVVRPTAVSHLLPKIMKKYALLS